MSEQPGTRGVGDLVASTVGAAIISVVVTLVSSVVVFVFIYFTQSIFTVIRPQIIAFFAMFPAAFAGVYFAKMANDKLFRHYSSRTVCVVLLLLSATLVASDIYRTGMHWNLVAQIAFALTLAWASVALFWLGRQEKLA